MKNTIVKILIFIFVPFTILAIIYFSINIYKKKKPGLYFEYKCKEDDKVFEENSQAKEAVCNGLYVPFGVKFKNKNYVDILIKMNELYKEDVLLIEDMKKLAQLASDQTIETPVEVK